MSPKRHALYRMLKVGTLPLATLAFLVPACFDQSTYQGGGRRDVGGTLVKVDAGEDQTDAGEVVVEDSGTPPVVDSGNVRDVVNDGG